MRAVDGRQIAGGGERGQDGERRVRVLGGLEHAERVGMQLGRGRRRCTTGATAQPKLSPTIGLAGAAGFTQHANQVWTSFIARLPDCELAALAQQVAEDLRSGWG